MMSERAARARRGHARHRRSRCMDEHGHVSIVMVGPRGRARGMIRLESGARQEGHGRRARRAAARRGQRQGRSAQRRLADVHPRRHLARLRRRRRFLQGLRHPARASPSVLGATYTGLLSMTVPTLAHRRSGLLLHRRHLRVPAPICRRAASCPRSCKHGRDIVYLTRQHLELVAVSGAIAIAIGLPLGIALTRPAIGAMPMRSRRSSISAPRSRRWRSWRWRCRCSASARRRRSSALVDADAAADRAQHHRRVCAWCRRI